MTPGRPNEIDRLVPFYANGTLDDFTRLRVAEYVRTEAAREDLAFCRLLRSELRSADGERPSETDWNNVWDSIERQISPIRHIGAAGTSRKRSESSWCVMRVASWAVAAALLVAMLGAGIAFDRGAFTGDGGSTTSSEGAYRLAGEQRPGEIVIQFRAGATAQQIRELLAGLELTVVDGPSALGVYELRLTDRDAGPAAIDRAVEVLRAHEIVSDASAL